MDSVLLAHFAPVGAKDRVADFGTGTGILPLLLIGRGKGSSFECFEIQESYAEMAERTMQMNALDNRVHIIRGDAAKAYEKIESCSMDAVICNPPYFKNSGNIPKGIQYSHHFIHSPIKI